MILPISTITTPSRIANLQHTDSLPVLNTQSTLSSMKCPMRAGTILGGINEFFSFILNFFKWLFCCVCRKKQTPSTKIELPRTLPMNLEPEDPFAKLVFTADGKIRNQEGFKKTTELFSMMGTSSYPMWIVKMFTLIELENQLKAIDFHPLEFLYMIFWSRESTQWITNYKDQAIQGAWVLSLKTGRAPWEEFLGKQARNFNKRKEEIPGAIEGFCKALQLNAEKVLHFTTKQNWEDLIQYVFEEKQKQFNIS